MTERTPVQDDPCDEMMPPPKKKGDNSQSLTQREATSVFL